MFTEPVKLIGEGKYKLDAVKEITVTESFLEMDLDVRKCQNEEPMEECTTRHYINDLLQQCDCLPLSISTSNKVFKIHIIKFIFRPISESYLLP